MEDTGKPHPALATRPILRRDCRGYWQAFMQLRNARQMYHWGAQAIAIGDVWALLNILGVSNPRMCRKYLRHIQRLDRLDLAHFDKLAKK